MSFSFKQFTVNHDLCAMKVGTDGVLLGAWVNCFQASFILDIGTGSGLIALMLAQRSNASIHAIDIDTDACKQANINVLQSPFKDRIQIFHSSLQDFFPSDKYDLIVSNPPYFINSLKSPDEQRSKARHSDTLPFSSLMKQSSRMLKKDGILSLILPYDSLPIANEEAYRYRLIPKRRTYIKPTPLLPPKRVLCEYGFSNQPLKENELTIEIARHQYSHDYIALTKDFYLKM